MAASSSARPGWQSGGTCGCRLPSATCREQRWHCGAVECVALV
jgi:hypothetical protein